MTKQQIFALEMDALTSRLQRLQLDKIITLLHELWDKMKIGGRRKVEITNDDGMEVTIGELIEHFTLRTTRNFGVIFVVI